MQPTMLQQADLDPLLRQCEVARARLAGDLSNGGLSAFALARQSDDLGWLRIGENGSSGWSCLERAVLPSVPVPWQHWQRAPITAGRSFAYPIIWIRI